MVRRVALACAVLVAIALQSACQPPPPSPVDAAFARLARCESGGNPRIVSSSGKYHGLYQFDQRTWDGVAQRVDSAWVGVRPSSAPADVQTAMARQLHAERGRRPWPVCGRRM
jgi:hypothetical protein